MNVFQCAHCRKLAKAESSANIANDNKCTFGSHSWKILGEVGPNEYHCDYCGKTVKTKGAPSSNNGKCRVEGSVSKPHHWQLIGSSKPTNTVKKQDTNNSYSSTKKSSSFLDKLGIIGLIIKVIWFPFRMVFKLLSLFGFNPKKLFGE